MTQTPLPRWLRDARTQTRLEILRANREHMLMSTRDLPTDVVVRLLDCINKEIHRCELDLRA